MSEPNHETEDGLRGIRKPLSGGRTQVIRREAEDKDSQTVVRARVENSMPCERYLARGYLSEKQASTANDMLRLYLMGQWVELKAASLEEKIKGTAQSEITDAAIDARKKLRWHLNRLEPAGDSVVLHVCCEGWEASAWAHYYGVSREYAMGRLREALDTLAK